ncbi:hypothetical protein PSV09DRAFT_2257489 [Bipolaris maydis]|uniref:uncharacterized protein n=1 Tax=Cochliobolus heterostrophus TaxID=5016 RepID=UPI0024DB0DFB|nr:hypothetical protein J3E74DRAFT_289992 [Bipolaris maydis]KAJ6210424.1 hypothetical protein PSV09DRAFT_2257489 [Bipolaris maydis]KAJ6272045.1 hypothetical protein PSV08DRAFT_246177 [Bipolaris maydis]KAJ6281866.1 hypothetical protein J3E71DRAFT_240835 [Bipolaris maydis]
MIFALTSLAGGVWGGLMTILGGSAESRMLRYYPNQVSLLAFYTPLRVSLLHFLTLALPLLPTPNCGNTVRTNARPPPSANSLRFSGSFPVGRAEAPQRAAVATARKGRRQRTCRLGPVSIINAFVDKVAVGLVKMPPLACASLAVGLLETL